MREKKIFGEKKNFFRKNFFWERKKIVGREKKFWERKKNFVGKKKNLGEKKIIFLCKKNFLEWEKKFTGEKNFAVDKKNFAVDRKKIWWREQKIFWEIKKFWRKKFLQLKEKQFVSEKNKLRSMRLWLTKVYECYSAYRSKGTPNQPLWSLWHHLHMHPRVYTGLCRSQVSPIIMGTRQLQLMAGAAVDSCMLVDLLVTAWSITPWPAAIPIQSGSRRYAAMVSTTEAFQANMLRAIFSPRNWRRFRFRIKGIAILIKLQHIQNALVYIRVNTNVGTCRAYLYRTLQCLVLHNL